MRQCGCHKNFTQFFSSLFPWALASHLLVGSDWPAATSASQNVPKQTWILLQVEDDSKEYMYM